MRADQVSQPEIFVNINVDNTTERCREESEGDEMESPDHSPMLPFGDEEPVENESQFYNFENHVADRSEITDDISNFWEHQNN